jgi:hypothetical protein
MEAIVKQVKGSMQSDVIEDEVYWNHHIDQHKVSGLSKKKYCDLNSINFNRFNYCIRKNREKPSSLVAVKVKPSEKYLKQATTLCTLNFGNGSYLQIHDVQALSIILREVQ